MKVIYINAAAKEQAQKQQKDKREYGPAIGSDGLINNYEEEYGNGN